MAKQPKHKFVHHQNYEGRQPATLKSLYPGMVVEFTYSAEDIFDKKPLILLLYNEYGETNLIHGLNLNYLKETEVQRLFCNCELLYKGASVYSNDPISRTIQSQMSDYDDTLPNRNLLKEEFTRIMLPTYKEGLRGNPLGKAEAVRRMKVLYDKVIKKMARKNDFYRTYKPSNMSSIKVLKYKLGEWNQPTLR